MRSSAEFLKDPISIENPLARTRGIGHLGIGTFSEAAATAFVTKDIMKKYGISLGTHEKLIEAVSNGSLYQAVIAIDNGIAGMVVGSSNMLYKIITSANSEYKTAIISAMSIPIAFAVASLTPRTLEDTQDITEVWGHPHALAQCAGNIRKHFPNARLVEADNNASGFQEIYDKERNDIVAIGPLQTVELFGLHLMANHFEDKPGNRTLFLINDLPYSAEFELTEEIIDAAIAKRKVTYQEVARLLIRINQQIPNVSYEQYETFLAFRLFNKPNELGLVASLLGLYGFNLVRIHNQSADLKNYEFFLALVWGHRAQPRFQEALSLLQQACEFIEVLGSFPTDVKGEQYA
jgi:prephenate dehydratase